MRHLQQLRFRVLQCTREFQHLFNRAGWANNHSLGLSFHYLQISFRCLYSAITARHQACFLVASSKSVCTITTCHKRETLVARRCLPLQRSCCTHDGDLEVAVRSQGLGGSDVQVCTVHRGAYLGGGHLAKVCLCAGLVSQSRIHCGCGLAIADSGDLHTAAASLPRY
jgi:hypothetical protein